MRLNIEVLDSSVEVRTTMGKNKTSLLEMYMFLPSDMGIIERDISSEHFLELKASRYHYSISKVKFPLLKLKGAKSESNIDFPIFLKTFKLKLSKLAQDISDIKNDTREFIETVQSLLDDLRSTPTSETNIKDFRIADELCSYYAEQITLVYYDNCKKVKMNTANYDELIKLACAEREYRKQAYGLNSKEALYIRRKENYFCKSINITQKNSPLGGVRNQVAFSLSAFLSMLFTTLVVFYFQMGYGSFSFAVLMALCVSYIFKDRFKELFRNYVAKKLSKGQFSTKTLLTDSDDNIVGRCYDMAEFVIPDEDISFVRGKGKYTRKDASEVVICYKKKYDISNSFMNSFSQIRDTMDVNLHSLLELLPDKTLRHTSYENGELTKHKFSMLHDINIIVRLNSTKIERYRLKVSHSHIDKIELVKWSAKGTKA